MTLESESLFDPEANLCYGDIAINDPEKPSVIRVCIKASTTDPFRKGVNVYLGRANKDLCPL